MSLDSNSKHWWRNSDGDKNNDSPVNHHLLYAQHTESVSGWRCNAEVLPLEGCSQTSLHIVMWRMDSKPSLLIRSWSLFDSEGVCEVRSHSVACSKLYHHMCRWWTTEPSLSGSITLTVNVNVWKFMGGLLWEAGLSGLRTDLQSNTGYAGHDTGTFLLVH